MKLGYNLTIEQSQKLVMTPELIQAIQILQFNTQELNLYVSEQLLTNPVLDTENTAEPEAVSADEKETDRSKEEAEERAKEAQEDVLKEYIKERDFDDISYKQTDYSQKEQTHSLEQYVSSEVTLPEHLMFQLQFASNNKDCRRIGKYIIESLDENGYMTSNEEEIAEALGNSKENIEKVLKLIQSFDPIGICAKSLGQCLLIQLENKGKKDKVFEKILMDHIEDIADNRLSIIAKSVGISVQDVQDLADEIKTLDPRPGRQFAGQDETKYIVPDIQVEKIDGEYVVTVNESSTPRLMVSSYYEKVLAESGQDEKISQYLTERLNSALWLIKSIEQRKQTVKNVVTSIVKFQKNFFDYGNKHLKTLTLKDIAEDLGIHESTVSRSINGKYMQSPRGVYELKYFFSAGVTAGQGEGMSSNSVKTYIKEIIEDESPKSPYSDQKLVELLANRGIYISRRTVAKYRDEMNILSSSKRKRY